MPTPVKPPALRPGGVISVVSPASAAEEGRLRLGSAELEKLGYVVRRDASRLKPVGYFAGSTEARLAELEAALADPGSSAVIGARGGYGSMYLLDRLDPSRLNRPKIVLGHSDITSLQIFLWEKLRWVTFYGPMVAAGFNFHADGYDRDSFVAAVSGAKPSWSLDLAGETIHPGQAEGVLTGGCLTLLEATLGTSWELKLEAEGPGWILALEDRAVKPYQLDRMLAHLRQAAKFRHVRGFVLGEFPESEAPPGSGFTVRDVIGRILGELGVPVVWNVPFGHTMRPMMTLPLGVRAKLIAEGKGRLEIQETAVRV